MTANFCVFIIMGALLVPTTTVAQYNSTTKAAVTTTTVAQGNGTTKAVSNTTVAQGNGTSNASVTPPGSNLQGSTTPTANKTSSNASTTLRPEITTYSTSTTVTSSNRTTGVPRTTPSPASKDEGKLKPHPTKPTAGKTTTDTPQQSQTQKGKKYIFLIIFITVMICLVVVITLCYVKRRSRRSSLDLHTKSEDAHIPLTPVAINAHNNDSPKEMETFTTGKDDAPAETAAVPDGEKALTEADQKPTETSAEAQAPVAAVEKPSEMTIVDLNEPSISAKTSVETLDELANENNSNSKAQASVYGTGCMTEICLLD